MNGTRRRRITADDLPHLIALDDDTEVMRFLNGGLPADRHYIEEVVLPSFLASGKDGPYLGVWAVETDLHSAGGPGFLGWVSLRLLDPTDPRTATLGFRFRRAAWGHGHATTTAGSLLGAAFESGAVGRVVANTYQDNLGSQRVLEKLGFSLVRRFRPTAADFAARATFAIGGEVWDGDELVFESTSPPVIAR